MIAPIWSPEAPLASVLIATRNRTEILKGTIAAILDAAANPDEIEILVRVHFSDPKTMEWAMDQDRVRILGGGDDRGYNSMDMFTNSLAAISTGDWLMMWSDENRITTKGWDLILAKHDAAAPLYLYPRTHKFVPGCRIPVVSRALYHMLGYLGATFFADVWMDTLARAAGIAHPLDFDTEMVPGLPSVTDRGDAVYKDAVAEYCGAYSKWRWEMDLAKLGACMRKDLSRTRMWKRDGMP